MCFEEAYKVTVKRQLGLRDVFVVMLWDLLSCRLTQKKFFNTSIYTEHITK